MNQESLSIYLSKLLIHDISLIILSYDTLLHRYRYDNPHDTLCAKHYRNYRRAISSGQYHRAYRITIHCRYMKLNNRRYSYCCINSIQSLKRVKCFDPFCKVMLISQIHGDCVLCCKDHTKDYSNSYAAKKSVFAHHHIQ